MPIAPLDHDTAGVPFPPPLAFLGGLGLGFGLQCFVPLPILTSASSQGSLAVAAVLVAFAALSLAASAFVSFRLGRTSPFPERPATALVIRGPFRFTRNPLYLAMALLHVAVSLFFNALWPLLFILPALLAIRLLVIAREERYLLRRFGAQYEAYCRSVRRWL